MPKRIVLVTALLSSAATYALTTFPTQLKLENSRVKVTEVTYPPGVARERDTRKTDQVIVFLDDCRYERKDSATGEMTIRERKAGDVIWHNKGEDAPQLTNVGTSPYRTLVIEIK